MVVKLKLLRRYATRKPTADLESSAPSGLMLDAETAMLGMVVTAALLN